MGNGRGRNGWREYLPSLGLKSSVVASVALSICPAGGERWWRRLGAGGKSFYIKAHVLMAVYSINPMAVKCKTQTSLGTKEGLNPGLPPSHGSAQIIESHHGDRVLLACFPPVLHIFFTLVPGGPA